MLKTRITATCIIATLLLIACASTQITPVETSFPSPTIISPTFTLTPLPTQTFTPTATFTLTPPVTLEPHQAEATLQQLLLKQEPCQLSCFWGVTPDQTTLGEAQNIFMRLGIPLSHTRQENEKDFFATEFETQSGVDVLIVLRVQNGLVDSANTNIGFTNYKGSPIPRKWLAFSLETILIQYGMPTYVEFEIGIAPCEVSSPCMVSYGMIMYFDKSNLVIEYNGKLVRDEKIIKVCPLIDSFDSVSVWSGKNSENMPTRQGVPLEKVTTLTLDRFYNLMLQRSPKSACFDLSRDAFPPFR